MDNLAKYIATGVVSLIVGLLLRNLEPKSKLVYWQPHYFLWQLEEPQVTLKTDSITLQNLGRRPAENVEVVFKSRPDFFQIAPSLPYTEKISPNGEFVICINALGPKEFFTLQLLSYATLPTVQNIRCKDGQGQFIQIQLQRQYPRWVYYLSALLLLVGAGFVAYWVIAAALHLSKKIGVL